MRLCKFFSNKRYPYSSKKKNLCSKCGKFRSYLRDFGLCRICVRFFILNGKIPGYTKANW